MGKSNARVFPSPISSSSFPTSSIIIKSFSEIIFTSAKINGIFETPKKNLPSIISPIRFKNICLLLLALLSLRPFTIDDFSATASISAITVLPISYIDTYEPTSPTNLIPSTVFT